MVNVASGTEICAVRYIDERGESMTDDLRPTHEALLRAAIALCETVTSNVIRKSHEEFAELERVLNERYAALNERYDQESDALIGLLEEELNHLEEERLFPCKPSPRVSMRLRTTKSEHDVALIRLLRRSNGIFTDDEIATLRQTQLLELNGRQHMRTQVIDHLKPYISGIINARKLIAMGRCRDARLALHEVLDRHAQV